MPFQIVSQLDYRIGGLLVSYLATREKIEQLGKINWMDQGLDRFSNKMRMKEVGGAYFSFRGYLTESVILSLSNTLEEFWASLRQECDFKYEVWKSEQVIEYERDARIVRALANVIKHNSGRIEASNSRHSQFLAEECGFQDGMDVQLLNFPGSTSIDLYQLVFRIYIYCLDLLSRASPFRHQILDHDAEGRLDEFEDILIPEVLGLRTRHTSR